MDFAFCTIPTHQPLQLDRPLTCDKLLEHTAISVGDVARSSSERRVELLLGQRRVTAPTTRTKMVAQAAEWAVASSTGMRAPFESEIEAPGLPYTFWLS